MNTWFRLYAEFAHDPKVQMLSEIDQRRLVMLFCLRCNVTVTLSCNSPVTLSDDEIAFSLRISHEEWHTTKATFIARGFINARNEVLNWEKRQFLSDSSAARVAKHRAKQKQDGKPVSNGSVTLHETKCNALDTDTDTDTEQSKSKPIAQLALLLAQNIPRPLAMDWLKIRKEKRQPLTETSLKATLREAEHAGLSLESAITVACENGWAGFKAEYIANKKFTDRRTIHDERADTIAALTGRRRTIEGTARVVG